MFAKRLLQKAVHHSQQNVQPGDLKSEDLDLRVAIHYGIPSTASLLAFDPIQRLLAIGSLDGRLKVIGGDGIEGLFMSPKQLPYKYIEFIQNQGFLIIVSNDNDIQVWNLESRCLACCLQWESNITAFSVISGSNFTYVGDECGLMSVIKCDAEDGKLSKLPYSISSNSLSEATGFSFPDDQPVVGILPQPHSSGNRVIIAYANGLIILWDVSEAQFLFIGGGKDLQLKDVVGSDAQDDASEHHLQEKEISAICWASSDGSILAVGYIDGDILFWNTSSVASSKGERSGQKKNVVKLQLSSAERRLPVIVLQWTSNNKSHNDYNGQLFIYGGDEIGSEEVLTVLSLEWSSGMETVRCVGRVDLTLTGSFADMILLPNLGATGGNQKADLFVLTNPGQLHLYEGTILSTLLSEKERKQFACPVEFPMVIPTVDPLMTMAMFSVLPSGGNSSKGLSELASLLKPGSTPIPAGEKWPLTGGVPIQLSVAKDNSVDRVYVAGYQDGTLRIWDASYPVLTPICVLEGEVQGTNVAGSSAPVTSLNFCWHTLTLAVGNECGVVRVYDLNGSCSKTSFHYVTETQNEVQSLPQGNRPQYKAVFSLLKSPVQALQFQNCGAKLAAGYESGHVAVLDVSLSSVLFVTDFASSLSSSIISLSWFEFQNAHGHIKSSEHSETEDAVKPEEEIMFILTKDGTVISINGANGEMIQPHPWHLKKEQTALSLYIIESSYSISELNCAQQLEESCKDTTTKTEPGLDAPSSGTEHLSSSEIASSHNHSIEELILLCCENSLRLYTMKSVIQGKDKTVHKVKHVKPCCWTTTFKKDGKVCGLLLLFQTGDIEIRSLPDLELIKESSIMSILKWNYKANMDKKMTSDNAEIVLASGCEVAFISLLAVENAFRIPESLPCLHDRVLAAAADAAFNFSSNQKKKQQGAATGILGGIVKGLKGGKANTSATPEFNFTHLERKFLNSPFVGASKNVIHKQEDVELDIDDIEIDEAPPVTSSSSHEAVTRKGEKETDREKLLGAPDDSAPRLRTPQEIRAKYRKTEDASSAAADARNKLVERQEKLERISRRTEELQSGAENFASLADELVKAMENRKWWQI